MRYLRPAPTVLLYKQLCVQWRKSSGCKYCTQTRERSGVIDDCGVLIISLNSRELCTMLRWEIQTWKTVCSSVGIIDQSCLVRGASECLHWIHKSSEYKSYVSQCCVVFVKKSFSDKRKGQTEPDCRCWDKLHRLMRQLQVIMREGNFSATLSFSRAPRFLWEPTWWLELNKTLLYIHLYEQMAKSSLFSLILYNFTVTLIDGKMFFTQKYDGLGLCKVLMP